MKYDFKTLPNRWRSGAEKFYNMRQLAPEAGADILPFSVADMDFLPPPEMIERLQAYIGNEILGYTLPQDSYRQAVLDWIRRRHGLEIPGEWIVDADNVIGAMRQMISAFTKPEDQIVVFSPVYMPFLYSVKALKRKLYQCQLVLGEDMQYRIDYDQFEQICAMPETTMLLFCNPHNPIGKVWKKEELLQVADICHRYHVFMISDEIHWDLIMPGHTFTSLAALGDPYLSDCAVNTASTKTFNTAALKGSVAILPDPDRRSAYLDLNGIAGRGILSYISCETGYRYCEEWLDELLQVLEENRQMMTNFLTERIPEVGVIPLEGTYLQWLDFRFLGLDEKALEQFMVHQAQCFFTEGYKFGAGGAGFERWNIACPKAVLLRGLERMEKAVGEVRK